MEFARKGRNCWIYIKSALHVPFLQLPHSYCKRYTRETALPKRLKNFLTP